MPKTNNLVHKKESNAATVLKRENSSQDVTRRNKAGLAHKTNEMQNFDSHEVSLDEDQPNGKEKQQKENSYAFKLFDVDEVKKSFGENEKEFSRNKGKQDDIHKKLMEHCGYVSPRTLPDTFVDVLKELDQNFPHFSKVTQYLRQRMRLISLRNEPVLSFGANILLDGPAGVGKSAYLLELSQKLGTLFHSVDCASVTNGFDLTGMSAKWNGGSSGKLHDLLFNHECPNPIILLDEVDKSVDNNNHPFMNTLYGLLEKNNAKHFRDEFVQVRMDASLINWFATSNYADRLDPPIRDRFEVLTVKAPSTEDLRLIIPKLYKKMIQQETLEKVFAAKLDKDVIEKLSLMDGISLRRINSSLLEALSNAVERLGYNQKTSRKVRLQVSDIPEVKVCSQGESNRMGYIWG